MDSKSTTRPFPGFDRVFWFHDPNGRAYYPQLEVSASDGYSITRAELTGTRPVVVRWALRGRQPSDVVHHSYPSAIIVHHRVVDLFSEHQFTGWDTYEVEVFDKSGARVTGYYGLSFPGRCGPIDYGRSVRIDKRFPGGIFPVWKGLYFDPATWDGSDLFMAEGNTGWIFAVNEVRRALMKAKIKNIAFMPLDEVELSATAMRSHLEGSGNAS